MAIDPRRLRPSELCRLVNSTPLGTVLDERQLHRHRTRAGFRIGDGRHVDLFRYAAWLVELRHTPRPQADGDPYEKLKERAAARNKALSLAGRDIGELPAVANPERKAKAEQDFRFFCEQYFPMTFHPRWSAGWPACGGSLGWCQWSMTSSLNQKVIEPRCTSDSLYLLPLVIWYVALRVAPLSSLRSAVNWVALLLVLRTQRQRSSTRPYSANSYLNPLFSGC